MTWQYKLIPADKRCTTEWVDVGTTTPGGVRLVTVAGDIQQIAFREKPRRTDEEIVAELRRLRAAFHELDPGMETGTHMVIDTLDRILRGDF